MCVYLIQHFRRRLCTSRRGSGLDSVLPASKTPHLPTFATSSPLGLAGTLEWAARACPGAPRALEMAARACPGATRALEMAAWAWPSVTGLLGRFSVPPDQSVRNGCSGMRRRRQNAWKHHTCWCFWLRACRSRGNQENLSKKLKKKQIRKNRARRRRENRDNQLKLKQTS